MSKHRIGGILIAVVLLFSAQVLLAADAPKVDQGAPTVTTSAGEAGSATSAASATQAQAKGPVAVPQPSAKAVRYYRSGNWFWAVSVLWGLLVPAVILFTGFSARMRTWATRISRDKWFFTIAVYLVIFTLVTTLIDLPLSYYLDFVREHAYGLSSQTLGKWAEDSIKGTLIGMVIGALFLWVPYLFLKKARQRWWLYTALIALPFMVFMMVIQPIWIAPLFNKFGPMQDKTLEAKILHQADRAGIEGARVFEVNKSVDTNTVNAYVTGIGSSKRIVLWDTTLKKLDPREVLFVLGHEMGHYVLDHIWKSLAIGFFVLLFGLYMVHRSADWALRRFGARFGFTELHDVASLPLILLLFSLFTFVLSPVTLAVSRHFEHEADRFGLEITHDNHSCATAFVKLTNDNLGYPRPGLLYKLWRSSHPPLGERIDFCNSYHPWSDGGQQEYAHLFKQG